MVGSTIPGMQERAKPSSVRLTLFLLALMACVIPGTADAAGAPEPDAQIADEPTTPYQPPEIQRDLSTLPFPVRRMRELLIEAAKSGMIERLRPYIGSEPDVTQLSFGEMDGDPIEFLKSLSGDDEGFEILAILQEVLETGFVHIDVGTENEMYVWPYFYRVSLDDLTAQQRVELYHLLTHGDFEDMKAFGAYIFYRVGITPQGRWRFFVAGD
jgi:hypothetical protein